MKKFVLLLILPFYVLSAMAQDMLVTNEGKSMTIYNLEISDQSIFFQLSDKADAPLQKMLKKDVLIIKKADGTKLDLNAPQAVTTKENQNPKENKETDNTPSIENVTIDDLSPESKKDHETWWDNFSSYTNYTITEEKDRKKEADRVDIWLGVKKGSLCYDETINIATSRGSMYKDTKNAIPIFREMRWPEQAPAIKYTLKNKSNQTIYIDLGNTFFVRMGHSHCFYTPSSTTSSKTSSTGVGVNAGAVASALGIGGTVGTLANGVNVGVGSTNGTTTTTYAQRIIALAPNASIDLEPQYLFGTEPGIIYDGLSYESFMSLYSFIYRAKFNFSPKYTGKKFMAGDECRYTEETSPLHWTFVVAYSKTENCQNLKTLSYGIYLKQLFGYKYNSWSGGSKTNYKYDNGYGHCFIGEVENVNYKASFPMNK